jgi:hypothetical protein
VAERFRIVPMEPWHYAAAAGTAFPWQDNERSGHTLATSGPAFTAFVDGEIAAVAGMVTRWPGQGDAWAVWTDVGRRHPMFVHRAVVRLLRAVIRDYALERVTADTVREFHAGRGWLHALGFRKECVMPRYGPRCEDFVRYRLLVTR